MFYLVDKEKCEFVGPYECSICGGHLMLDLTFLDQVEPDKIDCPYCGTSDKVVG